MDEPGIFYVLERRAVVTGDQLVDAQPTFDQNNQPAVSFRFNPAGGAAFGAYTAENIGNPFAIVLDEQVISAPVIQAHISGGSGIITGNFTPEESAQLAILLRAGALPAEITVLEQRTVGPELGADSIAARASMAALVAFVGIIAFMVAVYGFFGVIASVGMVMNIVLLMALMTAARRDADHAGHRRPRALDRHGGRRQRADLRAHPRGGEDRARRLARRSTPASRRRSSPILDGNLTTLIVAGILYAMGARAGARLRHHAGARPALLDVHRDLAVAAARHLLVRLAAAEDRRDLRHPHAPSAARSRRHQHRLLQADALLAGDLARSACSLR